MGNRIGFAACCGLALFLVVAAAHGAEPIGDEKLRIQALQAIFPGMKVSIEEGKRIDSSWPKNPSQSDMTFPDALASEAVYRVIGKAMNSAEEGASENQITQEPAQVREVRLRLFRWPGEDNSLLAVLQYNFPQASPPLSVASIGLLVRLVKSADSWRENGSYLLETTHHDSLQMINLEPLKEGNKEKLLVESQYGGAETIASNLRVFDLEAGKFDLAVDVSTRWESGSTEEYRQVFDLGKTQRTHGQRFCFSKEVRLKNGHGFDPPRVTHPCYAHGTGIDREDESYLQGMLTSSR